MKNLGREKMKIYGPGGDEKLGLRALSPGVRSQASVIVSFERTESTHSIAQAFWMSTGFSDVKEALGKFRLTRIGILT